MAEPPAFDLQAHSLHSDGELSPAAVVRAAAEAGVQLFSLTDHDTVDGVDEALEAARAAGIGLVPGTEISAIQHDAVDVHVLGYRIDHRDAAFLDRLAGFRADRELRAERLADRLGELGWALDRTGIEARRAAGEPVGRPHVAAAVLAHPENAVRLKAEGLADPGRFIEAYLVPGAPGFVGRTTPAVPEAIEAIHAAGGIAVWAHPFWDVDDPAEALATLGRFAAGGLDGVEVFYATHSREQTHVLADRCDELGLLQTGSSDFHGFAHGHFAGFRRFELFGREPVLGPLAAG